MAILSIVSPICIVGIMCMIETEIIEAVIRDCEPYWSGDFCLPPFGCGNDCSLDGRRRTLASRSKRIVDVSIDAVSGHHKGLFPRKFSNDADCHLASGGAGRSCRGDSLRGESVW